MSVSWGEMLDGAKSITGTKLAGISGNAPRTPEFADAMHVDGDVPFSPTQGLPFIPTGNGIKR